ncbi:MAG: class I SAM-dependent methyltransferase [Chloroflexi bacterium]|nr:class I SAM-dependent methyltransferase [Chloroflexota bacterium]
MLNDPGLLSLLCCLGCRGELQIEQIGEVSPDGHIITGKLKCLGCTDTYPIIAGIPRFVPEAMTTEVSTTVAGFGYQWQYANPFIQNKQFTTSEVFLSFIQPVQPDYFREKIVFDAGCGSGRFVCWAQQFGAAAAIGADLSESVNVAFQNTRHLPNVLIIQADLFALPLRPCFDYVFSIGVLHHTADPRRAFDAIAGLVKIQGGVSAWVYSRENNGWITYLLNPIRYKLTSRLPHRILLVLSYIITAPIFFILKIVYKPVGASRRLAGLRKHLFYFDYLYFLSDFGFHEQALIVFDHLVPTLAEYISHEEFAHWFEENGLQNVVITSRAGNSWRGFGVRPLEKAGV